jgi:hypothetical protein
MMWCKELYKDNIQVEFVVGKENNLADFLL